MNDITSFQQAFASSRKVLALVGAGLSASSGLPTFRGAGGLWRGYDALELATPDAFLTDPGLVWQFYSARRVAALKARPNNGHYVLAELSKQMGPDRFLTLTQNVDGLSQRAHHPVNGLLHMHGDLFSLKCTSFSCTHEETNFDKFLTPTLRQVYRGEESIPSSGSPTEHHEDKEDTDSENESLEKEDQTTDTSNQQDKDTENVLVPNLAEDELPMCPKCRGLMRPGVVWFGEPLPLKVMDRADQFVTSGEVDLILVIGTSGTVWPAAGYVEQVVMRGGKVAVFNMDAVADADFMFTGDAAEWLPKLFEPIVGKIKKRKFNDMTSGR